MRDLPRVSVVMPVRNEAAYIHRSLAAVFDQQYPPDRLEIIVADGCSEDGTRQLIEQWQRHHPNLKLIDNPSRIVAAGLNAALAAATGEIVVRVDGHCEIAADYVRRCVDHLQDGAVQGVGGPIRTVGETWTARAIAAAMSSKFGVGNSAFRTLTDRTQLADTVAFPAYTRAAIELAGDYDPELVRNQDDEYNYRLRKLGAKLLLAADVQARYYSRSSLRSLWRQYFQYGFWKVRVLQKHRRQMQLRQFVPPLFVSVLLAAVGAALVSDPGRPIAALIFGSYLVVNIAASIATAATNGWRLLIPLPLAFAILHLSYGCGFLVGLVHFRRRWFMTEPSLSWSKPQVTRAE